MTLDLVVHGGIVMSCDLQHVKFLMVFALLFSE